MANPVDGSDDCLEIEAVRLSGLKPTTGMSDSAIGALTLTQTRAGLRSAEADERAVFWARFSALCGTVTIFAIAFSAWQFYDQRQTWRIERSIDFIRQGNEGRIVDAKLQLSDLYERYLASEHAGTFVDFAKEQDARAEIYYDVYIGYWQQIAICAERLCDEEILRDYLGPGDAPMFEQACPMILRYRQSVPEYGRKAEAFLGADCGTVEARAHRPPGSRERGRSEKA